MNNDCRQCTVCLEKKLDSDFYRNASGEFRKTCKQCSYKRKQELISNDSGRQSSLQDSGRKYYLRNRDMRIEDNKERRIVKKEQYSKARIARYLEKKSEGIAEYQKVLKDEPGKRYASHSVFLAIKNGKLVRPETCSSCMQRRPLEAHHESYLMKDRLDVQWLCVQCHRTYHVDHDVTVVLLDIGTVIAPYVENDNNIDIFKRAVLALPSEDKTSCRTCEEIDIFEKVFKFLRHPTAIILRAEYGELKRNMNGVSLIIHHQEKSTD